MHLGFIRCGYGWCALTGGGFEVVDFCHGMVVSINWLDAIT